MQTSPSVLILGGTTEAYDLAAALVAHGVSRVVTSFAGRTRTPRLPAGKWRSGGFGGAEGLAAYLRAEKFDAVIDATHPFAAAMAINAAEACTQEGVKLLRLEREPWRAGPGDRWTEVDTLDEAAVNLRCGAKRVLMAVGRQELAPFVSLDDVWFLIRSVEAPEPMPAFKKYELLLSRGPFDVAGERALLRDKRIDLIVCKNSGGTATQAKLIAARELGIQVIMKRRPPRPELPIAYTIDDALAWIKIR
ncbi:MAG: cobalt-precorrin-6A reductase [Alphaproteobacteria bacterium]|nr:cobalt-precorrin-6A reductase [Alphaproteobacteria bacterium]